MTTPPTTLHDRLRAELDRRLTVARAAARGYFTVAPLSNAVGEHASPINAFRALHDPADAIRRYLGELEVLRRYRELAAESESRLTHDEIVERLAQLALLHELIEESAGRLGGERRWVAN